MLAHMPSWDDQPMQRSSALVCPVQCSLSMSDVRCPSRIHNFQLFLGAIFCFVCWCNIAAAESGQMMMCKGGVGGQQTITFGTTATKLQYHNYNHTKSQSHNFNHNHKHKQSHLAQPQRKYHNHKHKNPNQNHKQSQTQKSQSHKHKHNKKQRITFGTTATKPQYQTVHLGKPARTIFPVFL